MSPGPVNYKSSDGAWRPIDNRVVADTTGWHNKANDYSVHFPSDIATGVLLGRDGESLRFTLDEAQGSGIVSASDAVTYANALPGVDVRYDVRNDEVKESFVLRDVAAASQRLRFSVVGTPGLSIRPTPGGGADVLRASGERLFHLLAPTLDDAAGAHSDAVAMQVSPTAAGWVLDLVPDASWLAAPERQWPVILDPIASTGTPVDSYLDQAAPSTANGTSQALLVDNTGTVEKRSVLRFDGLTSAIPHDALVLNAKLMLWLGSRTGADTGAPVSLNRLTRSGWTSSATWNTYDGTNNWTTAGGDYTTTGAVSINVAGVGFLQQWYITQMVQDWADGTQPNYGMLLRRTSSGDQLSFRSQDYTDSTKWPSLWVAYEPRIGGNIASTSVDFQLTDRLGVGVNVSNGNFHLASSDLSIRGTGLNQQLTSFYDNHDTTGDPGTGFRLGPAWSGLWEFGDGSFAEYDLVGPVGTFKPDGSGGYIAPPGANSTAAYDTVNDRYTITKNGSRAVSTYEMRGGVRTLVKVTDRNGNAITLGHDVSGNLSSITDTVGRVTTVARSGGYYSSVTDSTGRSVSYARYANGCGCALEKTTDADGKATTYNYDTSGNLKYITDTLGNLTRINYDTAPEPDRVISVYRYRNPPTNNVAYQWTFSYTHNTTGGTTVVTDPNSNATTYAWNKAGQVTSVTDALGHAKSTTYNPNNDADSFTDALSAASTLSYDTNNNLTSILAPASSAGGGQLGAETKLAYSTSSTVPGYTFLPSSKTDAQGNCQSFTYTTGKGNLAEVYDGTGNTCNNPTSGAKYTNTYQSDPTASCGGHAGELCTSTDPRGNTTSYAYTYSGTSPLVLQTLVITPPTESVGTTPPTQLGATTVSFDSLTRVSTVTDGKGQKTLYCYDKLDRVDRVYYGAGVGTTCTTASPSVDYTWNGIGSLTSRVDSTGTTTYTYNALNRLRRIFLPDTNTVCATDTNIPKGINVLFDGPGNLIEYCDAGGVITYTYDAANRVTGMAEPTGSCTGVVLLCTSFGYDNADRRTSTTFPGGATQTTTYDPAGNILTTVGKSSTNVTRTSFSYTYTSGLNDRALRQSVNDNTATTYFTYNAQNRLCFVAVASGSTCTSSPTGSNKKFGYDDNGNRTTVVTSAGTTTSSFNKNNELCAAIASGCGASATYGFDANGNQTSAPSSSTFTYNNADQTTAMTFGGQTLSSVSYADIGQRERTAYTHSGTTTNLATTPLGVMISRPSSGSTSYFMRDSGGNLIGERVGGTRYYYLTDGLGSIVAVINDSGSTVHNTYTYDAWGVITASTGTVANPWKFTGAYQDPTGLYKMGARYYDAPNGRWTQPDPLGGTISNPSEVNKYLYVGDNPVNYTDPAGLLRFTWRGVIATLGTFMLASVVVGGICAATAGIGCAIAAGVAAGTVTAVGIATLGGSRRQALIGGLCAGGGVTLGMLSATAGGIASVACGIGTT